MAKLQFETDNATHGLTHAKGFAWVERHGIKFEYQVSDSILEILKSEIKEVLISFEEIQNIRFKNSWFSGGTVYIGLNSLKAMDGIPFVEDGEIVLSLKRNQKDNGKEFAVNGDLELSNFRMEKLNSL